MTAFKFAIWPKVLIIPPKLQNCHKGSTVSEHTFVSLYYSSETCFICCKVCSPRLVTPLQNATFATFMPFYKNPYNLKKVTPYIVFLLRHITAVLKQNQKSQTNVAALAVDNTYLSTSSAHIWNYHDGIINAGLQEINFRSSTKCQSQHISPIMWLFECFFREFWQQLF